MRKSLFSLAVLTLSFSSFSAFGLHEFLKVKVTNAADDLCVKVVSDMGQATLKPNETADVKGFHSVKFIYTSYDSTNGCGSTSVGQGDVGINNSEDNSGTSKVSIGTQGPNIFVTGLLNSNFYKIDAGEERTKVIDTQNANVIARIDRNS